MDSDFSVYLDQKLEVHSQEENSLVESFKETRSPQPALEPVMMMIMNIKYQKPEVNEKLNDKRFEDVQSFLEEILSIL